MMEYPTRKEFGHGGKPVDFTCPDWATFNAGVSLKELEELFSLGRRLADEDAKKETHTFASLVGESEEFQERLDRVFGPLQHLDGAMQTDEIRAANEKAVALRSDFGSDIVMHEGLYRAYLRYRESNEYKTLGAEERKIVDDTVEDFELAGVGISPKEKRKLKVLNKKAARLATRFQNNIAEAMKRWTKHITDEEILCGVPEVIRAAMKDAAQKKNRPGYSASLQSSVVFAILTYADSRELRKEMYIANVTKASDLGAGPKRLDNRPVIEAILAVQHERARLLGYANFAEFSLRKKMARHPERVFEFLSELSEKSRGRAQEEFATLEGFAREKLGLEKLEPWDVAYACEKLSIATYHVSQEEVRPYFTATKVFGGMFKLVERLYGFTVKEVVGVQKPSVWDSSVRFFRVCDKDGRLLAAFYADLYERPDEKIRKRPGAWADGCMNRRICLGGTRQIPVAYLNCNITPPPDGKDGQLTHDDVVTLFHEFGHDLHHMLGLPNYTASNWMRVEWDAIELPSQFMENYCWSKEVLKSLSAHVDTGEQIPDELCERLVASKHFQAGLATARQIELALIDMELYTAASPDIDAILESVRRRVRMTPVYEHDRFLNSFGHIFGGGYAAGYFSYKWAEVLAADAYEAFLETGNIYSPEIGARFLKEILEASGKRKMGESYLAFRGRMPSVDALLRQSGLLLR
ncbi:MAG TPA: M3 family metallopeptidase [Candidatus Paceibacterota bacterium]